MNNQLTSEGGRVMTCIGYERLSIVGDEGYITLFHKGPKPERTDKGQRGMLPYSVGLAGVTGSLMGRFATEQEAAEYIGTLPGHENGVYYLDGPDSFEADAEKDLGDGGLGSGRWLEGTQ